MSPLSTKYVDRRCNIHSPSLHTVTRHSMVHYTFRNVTLFFLALICFSCVQHSVALQPYRHSVAVIDPHEDIGGFLLVDAHDEDDALPSFSSTRYVAAAPGYVNPTLLSREADVYAGSKNTANAVALDPSGNAQQYGFARNVSSALVEGKSTSNASGNDSRVRIVPGQGMPVIETYLSKVIVEMYGPKTPINILAKNLHLKHIYNDADVVIMQEVANDERFYSYSITTGITHKSPYTQFIVDLAYFHRDFVAGYLLKNPGVSVKNILFTAPITLRVVTDPTKPSVVVAVEITGGKKFSFTPQALKFVNVVDLQGRLMKIQEYFNTVTSAYYGSGKADFNSGPGIPERVAKELTVVAANNVEYAIRTDGRYNIVDIGGGKYMYYLVGLDEIHRCMHQGINLIRAFYNPYTGAINTGSFTKSTAFATDYMRIPTGQTILDYDIVVDAQKKKGTVVVSTHISSNMASKSFKINGFDITFQQFDYNKSPQFHVARTLAAFAWPVDVRPVVEYIKSELSLSTNPTPAQLTTALEAPFVYDRMNGYLEELTSVARTVNPDTIVHELMAAIGAVGQDVSKQNQVRQEINTAFTAQLKYPLGNNKPRKNIVERVKRRVAELIEETLQVGSGDIKEKIAQVLFNWLRDSVNAAFRREQGIFSHSFTDIMPFDLDLGDPLATAAPATKRHRKE